MTSARLRAERGEIHGRTPSGSTLLCLNHRRRREAAPTQAFTESSTRTWSRNSKSTGIETVMSAGVRFNKCAVDRASWMSSASANERAGAGVDEPGLLTRRE
jgi:hypothetical protein